MRCNILPVRHLTDQHLLAERNELRFIPPLLKKKIKKENFFKDIPPRYVLGTGHQTFWIDKFLYLEKRYEQIVIELLRRKFNLNLSLELDTSLAKQVDCYNDWEPFPDDFDIIKERILQRIMMKPHWYRYYGEPISIEFINSFYKNETS